MIIDAHTHQPVYEGAVLLEEKKEKLLQKLIQNKIAKWIVISDSTLESEIGSMNDCAELFAHTDVYLLSEASARLLYLNSNFSN